MSSNQLPSYVPGQDTDIASVGPGKRSGKRYRAGRGRTSAGAEKWLNMVAWHDSGECLESLRASGFQIVVAAAEGEGTRPAHGWDWRVPTAVVLGNEQEGTKVEGTWPAHWYE